MGKTGLMDGVDDLRVAGAPADVAGQRLADLRVVGMWMAAQKVVRGDDQAWRAEAALHGPRLDERALHLLRVNAFDRDHLTPVRLAGEDEARAHQRAVEVDGARSALALLARVLRAIQAEPLAEDVEQRLPLPHTVGEEPPAVDGAVDPQLAHAHFRQRCAITFRACRR